MAETWLDDVIAPSLLQEIDVNKPVSPQLDISWEELLGEAPQVQVLAPSGSANDYPGLLIQEDIDSLLLKAFQFRNFTLPVGKLRDTYHTFMKVLASLCWSILWFCLA